tara:strand:+ start:7811 stop:8293 length:483 start_codon:yes stop_codon:yes gene_type:complete
MLLLSLGVSFFTVFFLKPDLFRTNIEAKIVENVWFDDIKKLEKADQLPDSWQQIRILQLQALSSKSALWLQESKHPIALNHKGKYLLEISVDHNEEEESLAVIMQYNLVDIASGNTLWEFGRTYIIPNKNWIYRGQMFLNLVNQFYEEPDPEAQRLPAEE